MAKVVLNDRCLEWQKMVLNDRNLQRVCLCMPSE